MGQQFLGKGWAFPVRLNDNGSIVMVAYEEDVEEAIRIILFTNPGERVMQPDFGCGIHKYVFESVNTLRIGMMQSSIHEALTRYEPRIDIITLKVEMDDRIEGKLLIDLTYRIRTTNNEFNKVYPFYLHEGKG